MAEQDRYLQYLKKLKEDYKPAVKMSWLNPDESIGFDFTDDIYNIDYSLNVNLEDGARRTCTITLDNQFNDYPVQFDNIWIGQKFQLWLGLYLDDGEPYYISQGIFVVTNPQEAYNPTTHTITIQGKDKWGMLDGTVYGYLSNVYKTQVITNMIDAATELLQTNRYDPLLEPTINKSKMIDCKTPIFNNMDMTEIVPQYTTEYGYTIYTKEGKYYIHKLEGVNDVWKKLSTNGDKYNYEDYTETADFQSTPEVYTQESSIYLTPYTSEIEPGKTYADVLLEYNTMIMGQIYYDRAGFLTFNPLPRDMDNLSVSDKEVDWEFSVTEKELTAVDIENKFNEVFNDVIVYGGIVGGKRMKGRVQNWDAASESSIDKIGLKTKPPYTDEKYLTDDECKRLAQYYAQTDMALERSGSITTTPIYHLDVDHLITLSTDLRSKETFLVTGFSLSSQGTMSINITNIKYFIHWTPYEYNEMGV